MSFTMIAPVLLSGCGAWRRVTGQPTAERVQGEARPAEVRGEPMAVLVRTQLTNQTGTRCRVLVTVVETPSGDTDTGDAEARWWWGEPMVLTATTSQEYQLRALAAERAPVGGARSVLLRVETLLGTRAETTVWYNIVGPVPTKIDLVREGDDVVPACYAPTIIEVLPQELWPEQPANQ